MPTTEFNLHPARFWSKQTFPSPPRIGEGQAGHRPAGEGLVCELCPHHCTLSDGQRGRCRSRVNHAGKLYAESYGRPCALAIDPVEKKPLREFMPGTFCLSLACTGCNLRCRNCQNYDISQSRPDEVRSAAWTPSDIVNATLQHGLPSIAYTYTEPLTWYEYLYDTALLAHEHGLKNILVSAGYVCQEPLQELLPYLDAANIDLKSLSDETYHSLNGASLQPVLDTLCAFRDSAVHLEITNLLIPGYNTSEEQLHALCHWLATNGFSRTPLHLSRFFPTYRLTDVPPTPLSTMHLAERIAYEEGIEHVYLGNV